MKKSNLEEQKKMTAKLQATHYLLNKNQTAWNNILVEKQKDSQKEKNLLVNIVL